MLNFFLTIGRQCTSQKERELSNTENEVHYRDDNRLKVDSTIAEGQNFFFVDLLQNVDMTIATTKMVEKITS